MKMETTLSERKNRILKLVKSSQDEAIIDEVLAILSGETGDWYDELTDEEKAELAEAEADVAAGRILTHEQVIQNLKNV
jgi:predicted transcriptional regulator